VAASACTCCISSCDKGTKTLDQNRIELGNPSGHRREGDGGEEEEEEGGERETYV